MIYEKETALFRHGLFEVQNEIGLGHHEEIYHKAMVIWLEQQNIPYTSKAPHPLLFDDNRFNISRGLSFMRSLGIPWGIAANFGKKQVQIKALSM